MATRCAQREAHKRPNPTLQSLLREQPLTANCALSWVICGSLICTLESRCHTSSDMHRSLPVLDNPKGDGRSKPVQNLCMVLAEISAYVKGCKLPALSHSPVSLHGLTGQASYKPRGRKLRRCRRWLV